MEQQDSEVNVETPETCIYSQTKLLNTYMVSFSTFKSSSIKMMWPQVVVGLYVGYDQDIPLKLAMIKTIMILSGSKKKDGNGCNASWVLSQSILQSIFCIPVGDIMVVYYWPIMKHTTLALVWRAVTP